MKKFGISFAKIFFPILFRMFSVLKINRRAANYFFEKSFFSNDNLNFDELIDSLLKNNKIIALDVGAQGGFNSDKFFPSKYNSYFEPILIEPIKDEAKKLEKESKYVIPNALWSSNIVKKVILYRHNQY